MSTALIVIDPYNDFVSPLGKAWPLVREVATDVGLVDHMRAAIAGARSNGIPVVYAPHHRYRRAEAQPRFPNASQYLSRLTHSFADGGYGGRFRSHLAPDAGEFIAAEHHISSGFTGTDLDAHLRSIGATHLVICGLLTNTCVESTVRHAVDLGYHVTVLSDAVASWGPEDHCAGITSLKRIAHSVRTTQSFLSTAEA